MKITKRFGWQSLLCLAVVLMMGVTMTACGDDDDEPGASKIEGIWVEEDELGSGDDELFAIKVNADGTGADGYWYPDTKTFEYEVDGEHVQWRWRENDGRYYIYELDGTQLPVYGTVSGNRMTIHAPGNDDTVYRKVK